MISVIIALIIGILVGKITKFHEKILSPRKIKIILVDRGHDKKAYLEDNKRCWDHGPTEADAIGCLLLTYPDKFNVEVVRKERERLGSMMVI